METVNIPIKIDPDRLEHYSDEHLAALWYVTQANPAPIGDPRASQIAEHVAREIVARWIRSTPIPLWNHHALQNRF